MASSFIDIGCKGRQNLCLQSKGRGDAICKAGNDYNLRIETIPRQQGLANSTVPASGAYSEEHRVDAYTIPLGVGSLQPLVSRGESRPLRGRRRATVLLRGQRPVQLRGLVSPGRGAGPAGLRPLPLAPGAARIHPPQQALAERGERLSAIPGWKCNGRHQGLAGNGDHDRYSL